MITHLPNFVKKICVFRKSIEAACPITKVSGGRSVKRNSRLVIGASLLFFCYLFIFLKKSRKPVSIYTIPIFSYFTFSRYG